MSATNWVENVGNVGTWYYPTGNNTRIANIPPFTPILAASWNLGGESRQLPTFITRHHRVVRLLTIFDLFDRF